MLRNDEGVPADASDPLASTSHRVDVPDRESTELEGDAAGADRIRRVIYRRQFHRPSGIEPGECVLLEVGEVQGHVVDIRLNAFTLGAAIDSGVSEPIDGFSQEQQVARRWNLDERLADHNELEIELESMSPANAPPRLIGEVNLWIVSSA